MARAEFVDGPTELDRVWGVHPRFYEIWFDEYLTAARRLDPVLFELCRLRMAQVLGNEFEPSLRYQPARAAAGLTEEKLAALTGYATSDLFTASERACLSFTEQFAIQSSGITDEDTDRMQTFVDSKEFVLLVQALGPMDQTQRACVALDIGPTDRVPRYLEGFVLASEVVGSSL